MDTRFQHNGKEYVLPGRFPWGPIQQIHAIGEMAIIEYIDTSAKPNRAAFHPYLLDQRYTAQGRDPCEGMVHDTGRAYDGLNPAILGALALRYDGINTRADVYMCRALGMINREE